MSYSRYFAAAALAIAVAGCSQPSQNAGEPGMDSSAAKEVTFAADIQPIIAERCAKCHVEETKGQFSLASLEAAMAGGKNGPAIASGDSAGSLLFQMVSGTAEKRMPPKGDPLSDAQIATIKSWIDSGAH